MHLVYIAHITSLGNLLGGGGGAQSHILLDIVQEIWQIARNMLSSPLHIINNVANKRPYWKKPEKKNIEWLMLLVINFIYPSYAILLFQCFCWHLMYLCRKALRKTKKLSWYYG